MCHRGQISGVPGFGCGLADEGPDNGGSVASAHVDENKSATFVPINLPIRSYMMS